MATIKFAADIDEVGITQTVVHEHWAEGVTAPSVPAAASGTRASPWSTAAFVLFVIAAIGVVTRDVIGIRDALDKQQVAEPEYGPVQRGGNGVTVEVSAKGIVVKTPDRSASASSSAAVASAASKPTRLKAPRNVQQPVQPPDPDPDEAATDKPVNP